MRKRYRAPSLFAILISLLNASACFANSPAFVSMMPAIAEMAYKATQIQMQFIVVKDYGTPAQPILSCQLTGMPSWATSVTFTASCSSAAKAATSYSGACNGGTISPTISFPEGSGSQCSFLLTVKGTPGTDSTSYSPKFTLTFGNRAQSFTSDTFGFSAASGKSTGTFRNITFQNYCPTVIYPGMAAGATKPAYLSSGATTKTTCTTGTNEGCYPGSTCVTTGPINQCFWNIPTPSNNYQLTAYSGSGAPSSTTFSIPVYDNGIQQQWSGNMAGRTNCTSPGYNCGVSDCGSTNSDGGCPLGQGFSTKGPITGNEITFQGGQGTLPAYQPNFAGLTIYKACGPTTGSCVILPDALGVDFYDVSTINGVTLPYAIKPTHDPLLSATDPYRCTPAGSTQPTSKLAASSWIFQPPAPEDYTWVHYTASPGSGCTVGGGGADGCACSTGHTTCTGTGSSCGIAYNTGGSTGTFLSQICGPDVITGAVGKPMTSYWTADEICAVDPTSNVGTLFNCSTDTDLNACLGSYSESCYTAGASDSCCGCPGPSIADQWSTLLGVPVPSSSTCKKTNSNWQTKALGINGSPTLPQPYVFWLKKACPTCYVYPYDDPNSTFTCGNGPKNSPNYNNTVNYTVIFCPQYAPVPL